MSARDDEKFDAMLLSLAQQVSQVKGQGLDPILETFFSFLRRRTDFFTGAEPAKIRAKLEEHVNVQLAVAKELEQQAAKAKKLREEKEAQQKEAQHKAKAVQQSSTPLKTTSGADSKVSIEMVDDSKPAAAPVADSVNATAAGGEEVKNTAPVAKPKAEGGEEEEEESAEDKGKIKPNEGNGGDFEKYSWTQTLKDANVLIPVPKGTGSKQIQWDISRTHMTVGLKGHSPILKGKLFADVRPDECHWTLEEIKGQRMLSIHLDKVSDMSWWDKVVEGEPPINTKKVTPENSKLSDLDGDTRQVVEKMMFDQRQKAMGKPTSEELKKMEILETLQKANPNLDFSKVNMSSGFGPGMNMS